jgi:hypothetical protein
MEAVERKRAKLGGRRRKKEKERERAGGAEGVLLAQKISEDDCEGMGEAVRTDNPCHSSRTSFNTAKQRPVTMGKRRIGGAEHGTGREAISARYGSGRKVNGCGGRGELLIPLSRVWLSLSLVHLSHFSFSFQFDSQVGSATAAAMDSYVAHPTPATSHASSSTLHPTSLLTSLANLASSSLDDHINEYADAHRWMDSFFDKLQQRSTSQGGAPRFVQLLPSIVPLSHSMLTRENDAALPCPS